MILILKSTEKFQKKKTLNKLKFQLLRKIFSVLKINIEIKFKKLYKIL